MSTKDKLRDIRQSTAECQHHMRRLAHVDSVAVQQEVVQLLKSDLRSIERDIENILHLAEQQDRQSETAAIMGRVTEYQSQLKQLQVAARQAILQSKQRLDTLEKRQRHEVLGRRQGEDQDSYAQRYELKQRHRDPSVLKASTDVTEALLKTTTLMQQELEKSAYSAIMLADSSKTLTSTRTEYGNLGSLLSISKRLVTQLESADWLDRFSLLLGLLFFCGVVFYIIKKRTWDVGISWIEWLSFSKATQAVSAVTMATSTAEIEW
ncbi:Sec20-domain-containing protein [Spinellus fusiger]|nr:Sec20-domain-containing protein [Spinellus fusiger]